MMMVKLLSKIMIDEIYLIQYFHHLLHYHYHYYHYHFVVFFHEILWFDLFVQKFQLQLIDLMSQIQLLFNSRDFRNCLFDKESEFISRKRVRKKERKKDR